MSNFLNPEVALLVVALLLATSELLAATTKLDENSVFQLVVKGLTKIKEFFNK